MTTDFAQTRPQPLKGILRDVFVLVLAEVLVLAVAWCLWPRGRCLLGRLFRDQRGCASQHAVDPTAINI